jgi:voltage-gated potassium channel
MRREGERNGKAFRPTLRRRIFNIIELGHEHDRLSYLFDGFIITLIIANVAAFALETVKPVHAEWSAFLYWFDHFSVAIFTLEYIARLWTAAEVPFLRDMPAWRARLKFARQPFLIIDLLAILPYYLSYLLPFVDLRILRLLRILRILKLARYSPALSALMRVLAIERRALLGALFLTITMLLFAATGIYFIEHRQPGTQFTSLPAAAWWAISTLTTVGYGDMVPQTHMGKIFSSIVMLVGLGLFALPIAIISTGFAQESQRRDFVLTWSLLSRIPIFARLSARAVAGIMEHLQAHSYPPGWEIVHHGQSGRSMFFIASGSVRVERPDFEVILHEGDFFGEIAMLEGKPYEYSYTSMSHARILELAKKDYNRLCRLMPEICEHIGSVAKARQQARRAGRAEPSGRDEPARDDDE